MTDLMKKGLVCGLLIVAVALLAFGCAKQEAPAPAPETPAMEEPAPMDAPAEDTTMAPAEDTAAAPAP